MHKTLSSANGPYHRTHFIGFSFTKTNISKAAQYDSVSAFLILVYWRGCWEWHLHHMVLFVHYHTHPLHLRLQHTLLQEQSWRRVWFWRIHWWWDWWKRFRLQSDWQLWILCSEWVVGEPSLPNQEIQHWCHSYAVAELLWRRMRGLHRYSFQITQA